MLRHPSPRRGAGGEASPVNLVNPFVNLAVSVLYNKQLIRLIPVNLRFRQIMPHITKITRDKSVIFL
jgi:hypothetical protein